MTRKKVKAVIEGKIEGMIDTGDPLHGEIKVAYDRVIDVKQRIVWIKNSTLAQKIQIADIVKEVKMIVVEGVVALAPTPHHTHLLQTSSIRLTKTNLLYRNLAMNNNNLSRKRSHVSFRQASSLSILIN